jgi:putative sigma-54 modulation protein
LPAEGVDAVRINVSIRHGHISEPTQAMIRQRLEKLQRLNERISEIELTANLEHRDQPAADLKVTAMKHEFVAIGGGDNLLAAVDEAVDRMEQQLRKHKEKVRDRHRVAGTEKTPD